MKKKLLLVACIALSICLLSSLLYFVSADSTTSELKDLPREQRDEIIQRKKESDQKAESASAEKRKKESDQKAESALAEKPKKESDQKQESALAESGDAPSLDFSSAEALFYSHGFTDEDLRTVPEMGISVHGEPEITQDYIYDRMLNTMDFYTTLQGKFRTTQFYSGVDYEVEYFVDGEDHQTFERTTDYGGGNTRNGEPLPNHETISHYDGKKFQEAIITYDDSGKRSMPEKEITHTSTSDAEEDKRLDFVALLKPSSRIQTDDDGINTYYYRRGYNNLLFSRLSLEPQELITGYLCDFSTWEISGQETLLDRSCSVIKGTLSGDYSEKLRTASFTLWVDNETGILLKLEGYNGDGELSETITTTEFQAGIPISADEIQKMFDEA